MGGGAGSLRCMVYLSATLHGMPYNNNTESVRRCADFQLSRCPTNVLHNSSILGYVMIPVNHTRAPRAFRCRNEFSGLFFFRVLFRIMGHLPTIPNPLPIQVFPKDLYIKPTCLVQHQAQNLREHFRVVLQRPIRRCNFIERGDILSALHAHPSYTTH